MYLLQTCLYGLIYVDNKSTKCSLCVVMCFIDWCLLPGGTCGEVQTIISGGLAIGCLFASYTKKHSSSSCKPVVDYHNSKENHTTGITVAIYFNRPLHQTYTWRLFLGEGRRGTHNFFCPLAPNTIVTPIPELLDRRTPKLYHMYKDHHRTITVHLDGDTPNSGETPA